MKRVFLFTSFLLSTILVFGQNPIVPPGIYIADPSAHVWNDGMLYIYGSLDESCDYYCSWRHHVIYTNDMANWLIRKNVFHSKGENDQVTQSDALLFAPDCGYLNNRYMLYYCMPDRNSAGGVAIAQSPTGPFVKGQKIDLGGYNEIDPSLFVDDKGEAYYLWGQFTLKMAKMKPNGKELELTTLRDSVLTEGEHFFHEGAFMFKRNGIYYLVYADISRAEKPTCIGYATSKKPFGPYTYRGVIVDNRHCNPGNWNNHGSVVQFNGKWYVFYHRSTHGCNTMRKACVEPIEFKDDGSIPEVEMTSQGAGAPLPATNKIDAERACLMIGKMRIQLFEPDNEMLTHIENGDKAVFKYIDFGDGVNNVLIRLAPKAKGGTLSLKIDKPWHKEIAKIAVQGTEKKNQWQIVKMEVKKVTGVHALWIQCWGFDNEMFDIDWIKFE